MKRTIGTLFIAVLVAVSGAEVFAHGNHHHGSGGAPFFCTEVKPGEATVPDFKPPRWKLVDKFQYGPLHMHSFYQDADQPNIFIAGVETIFKDATTGIFTKEVAWQIEETKYTIGLGPLARQKDICATSVIALDGSRRDLSGFHAGLRNKLKDMVRTETEEELTGIPPEIWDEFLHHGGYSLPNGPLFAKLETRKLRGGEESFTALITAFPVSNDLALFFYRGPSGMAYPLDKRWLVGILYRCKGSNDVCSWSRGEITTDDGGKIVIDPPLKDRPGFKPQLDSDSVF